MTKEEMTMLLDMFDDRLGKKLEPMNQKLNSMEKDLKTVKKDTTYIKKQVDILYGWVDGIDLDVREIKKAK